MIYKKAKEYKTFDLFLKEIKKHRREYEKSYIWNTKWYTINKKWKRREKYRDILCWISVHQAIKEMTIDLLYNIYNDNTMKIPKKQQNDKS